MAWLVKPKRVILSHHDNWMPGFSTDTDVEIIRKEMAQWVPRTELCELGYVDSFSIFG